MKIYRVNSVFMLGFIFFCGLTLAACAGSMPTEPEPHADPVEGGNESAQEDTAAGEEIEVNEQPEQILVPPSGSVNLKEITPVADDGGQVVMPAPGIPDLSVQMGQVASSRLADLKQVDISEITVVSTEAVTWPDSSLGCPKPGMMYLQVLTPGYIVMLALDGVNYEYHTDSRVAAVLCE